MLTRKEQRKLTELAFIRSIADKELDDNAIPNGRLRGLYLKLRKAVDKDIAITGLHPSKIDIHAIEKNLDKLKYAIGPRDEEFQAPAMSSFCLGLLEGPGDHSHVSDPVIEKLIDIIDYFERGGHQDLTRHCQDGQAAADTWEGLFAE